MTHCGSEPRAGLQFATSVPSRYFRFLEDTNSQTVGPVANKHSSLAWPCGFDRAAAQTRLVYSPQLITRPCGCSTTHLLPLERLRGEHMELVMILSRFWVRTCLFFIIMESRKSSVTLWLHEQGGALQCVATVVQSL